MTRLQAERQRLYRLPPAPAGAASGLTRAMVLELSRPPSWAVLGAVWQGVQVELGLPAPGIAVSGVEGLQLWFSVEAPVTLAQARTFLEGLAARFLAEVAPKRLRTWPTPEEHELPVVPALQAATGNWSAYLAPDLAPVFAETPWLDLEPGEEGQASLLHALAVMPQAGFEAACRQLAAAPPAPPAAAPATGRPDESDPRRFLLQVMNDASVSLALRIEAAKALLPR